MHQMTYGILLFARFVHYRVLIVKTKYIAPKTYSANVKMLHFNVYISVIFINYLVLSQTSEVFNVKGCIYFCFPKLMHMERYHYFQELFYR